ncbi:cyclopropane-fatty-acyl-phospholipid synthase [Pseudopedobacter saltans DSM 12145]|uniref:Cyclopropane-fatty-acyl-phospholipid synthase n=1 Tax=Pseudopedobacter saltans (strain ATCC 51119 / DSM 12145 / JCM 21818 / CCUG 39354 / LMG 10337 / NBRC 100064 / NCIMB 13643) TaxID=762903 RepID=F0S5L8_PSESL|nr:cyclopropane fatty acyl phospholipid synthase [Pseudopedobacter saltans]ADY54192.1 cyclopropane-fatty-acyl-phospholipid synthase [Pseudopedobacter saltans DSM 12145]
MNSQSFIEQTLTEAGITVNGENPFDIQINDNRFYKRVLKDGSLGLGESYMEGWWDCRALDDFLYRIIQFGGEKKVKTNINSICLVLAAKLFNRQSLKRATKVARKHYNLGNNLFEHILDKYMMYSCAYWNKASDLDQAQENKLDLICRKLKLSPGHKVLDIGCGWGGFAQFAAQNYGVQVTGVTISSNQAELASKRCANLPVEIKLKDYRDIAEKFDRIVSIGMFEHVGTKNYPVFMDVVHRNLKNDGIFLLHSIGGNENRITTDPWIDRYIFPNSVIPSPSQVSAAFEKQFTLQDWHNFGHYYDDTLMEWLRKFKIAWPAIKNQYDDQFYRMWEYYLNICAASFRSGKNHLWQIVLTKQCYNINYQSVR